MLYSEILAQWRMKGSSAGKLDAKKQICKKKLNAKQLGKLRNFRA
jgi:hypothetical protein